ncbi:ABC transporter ATP-binding protein [Halorientalis halophila]|uniref:ABC transporter ATP-binding protein n=1 Tax=Halorientalis halophila TaxID=3108499 RepID=UPI0030096D1C
MPAAIETEGLRKTYGDVTALADLDLSISAGTVYGFLGPNGAGKTTTMRILTTLTAPSDGDAWIAGEHVSDRDAVVSHLGYLPEEPPVYDELTAREQLSYLADLRDLGADERDRIDALLDRFGLSDDADDPIRTYSKGMRQKTALAGTVLGDPDVLFLDEPTSGLDPRAARTVRDLLAELAAQGRTIFLSTHVLPVVEELADEIGVLDGGRLVAEGTPAELQRRAETGADRGLEDAFLDLTAELGDPADADLGG